MIDVGAAYSILLILTAADRKVSEKELEVICNYLRSIYPLGFPSLEIARKTGSKYATLTPEGLAQALKDQAIKFKSVSTLQERANLLEWARLNICADGKINEGERVLFEFLSSIFNVGVDMGAMRQAQQQHDIGLKVLEWNHQRLMNNLSMWRTCW